MAAYVDDDGCARIIDNQEGENITASAVFFDNGTSIVGTDAKKESVIDSKHFVGFVKRQMGKSYVKYNIDGRDYKPEEISAIILSKLKRMWSWHLEKRFWGSHNCSGIFYGCSETGN